MSRPAPLLAALIVAAGLTADTDAETLVVGFEFPGPIARGDVALAPLGQLIDVGAVSALAPAADGTLFVATPASSSGGPDSAVRRIDPVSGAILDQWTVRGEVVALADSEAGLWSALSSGRLTLHDVANGGIKLSTLDTGRVTTALVCDGKILYQGTANGEVHSAPIAAPTWSHDATVFHPISALAIRGSWLLVGVVGHVYIVERDTGGFIYGYNVPNDAASIALSGNRVVVGGRDGSIALVDPNAGTVAEHGPLSVRGGSGPWPVAAMTVLDPAPLTSLTPAVSFASIGNRSPIKLRVEVSPDLGALSYLVLGSVSGDTPGLETHGVHVPLNPDPYLALTLLGSPTLTGALGTFSDSSGLGVPMAEAEFLLPEGLSPAVVGLTLHHAALVFDPLAPTLVTTSNAVKTFVAP